MLLQRALKRVGLVLLIASGFLCRQSLPVSAQNMPSCASGATGEQNAALQPGVDYDARLTLITFTDQCGQAVPLAVDIAANSERQETGLMNVAVLPREQGELFDMHNIAGGGEVRISFYMKDTLIPLSVAFIGADGTVRESQDMQPETLDLHTPAQPYLYAVEANQGWFDRHGILLGSHVDLSADEAQTQPQSST
ncbi:MAG: DUF192 domain-containing protein [Dehalococcoidia bacterium]